MCFAGTWKLSIVIVRIHLCGQREGFDVVDTDRTSGPFFCFGQGWEEHAGEYGDDRDHHQEFDQGKSISPFTSKTGFHGFSDNECSRSICCNGRFDVLTLCCYLDFMKRATVYFDEDLHKALKLRSVESSTTLSEFVNEAVKEALAEDLEDLESFRERESEPSIDFETFLRGLKKNGKL